MPNFKFHQHTRDTNKFQKMRKDFCNLTNVSFSKKYKMSLNEVRAWARSEGLRKNAKHCRRIRSQNASVRHATLCASDGITFHRLEIRVLPRGENLCDLARQIMSMACGKSFRPRAIFYARPTCSDCLLRSARTQKVKKHERQE